MESEQPLNMWRPSNSLCRVHQRRQVRQPRAELALVVLLPPNNARTTLLSACTSFQGFELQHGGSTGRVAESEYTDLADGVRAVEVGENIAERPAWCA